MSDGAFHMGAKPVPFWIGAERDPVKAAARIETAKKWEDMTRTCRDCGKVALYRVKMIGYCKEHYGEAQKAARTAKGLK